MIEFDACTHTYKIDGMVVPSVTQVLSILEDWSQVDHPTLSAAAEFGTHVHIACDLDNKGILNEGELDPSLLPYLSSWRRFVGESEVHVITGELQVASRVHRYAGTLDALIEWRGAICVLDIKTGATVPHTAGPQLAAYELAYNESFETATAIRLAPGKRARKRFVVQLNADSYRVHEMKNRTDWTVFQSALNCWRFKHAA